jgi:hypothetical protein
VERKGSPEIGIRESEGDGSGERLSRGRMVREKEGRKVLLSGDVCFTHVLLFDFNL